MISLQEHELEVNKLKKAHRTEVTELQHQLKVSSL